MRRGNASWSTCAIVVASGCGRFGFDSESRGGALADASPQVARCDPSKPFGPLTPLSQVNSPGADLGLELVDDGLVGFLWSDRLGVERIFETTRTTTADAFGPAVLVPVLPGTGNDRDPCPSGDGLSIVFSSTRSGGGGGSWDLWMSSRASRAAQFDPPVPVVATNDSAPNWGGYLISSGLALYYIRDQDMKVARRASPSDPFGAPASLGSLNTVFAEFEPAVTPDELTILFASDRPNGKGRLDIYAATRASTAVPFEAPVSLDELNSIGDDIPSWIAPDLCEIHMTQSTATQGSEIFHASRPL